MASKQSRPLTAWSYSRLKLYEQCPLKFKLKNLDKLPEPKSPHAQRGIDIHKKGENYLLGKLSRVPKEYSAFAEEMRQLKKHEASAEEKWAFTRDWEPTGYFDRDVWVRQITDASVVYEDGVVDVYDFKTGRIYDDYDDQMEMFATGAMSIFELVEEVRTNLLFLDVGKPIRQSFKPTELPYLKDKWESRTEAMFSDLEFAPKRNRYCGYCHFRRSNGGPCPYG